MEHLLEVVEHLGAHAQPLLERRCAHGTDHELLKCDGSVGVRTAVDDVHHRHGQRLGVRTADITVEGHAEIVGSGAGHGQRYAEDGVGTQIRLGLRAVEGDHRLVDTHLIGHVHADDRGSDLLVDVLHGVQHALAQIAALVAVTKLEGLVLARRRAARYGCTAECARYGTNFDLDGRIASRVEDLSCVNLYNLHSCNSLILWFTNLFVRFRPQRYEIIAKCGSAAVIFSRIGCKRSPQPEAGQAFGEVFRTTTRPCRLQTSLPYGRRPRFTKPPGTAFSANSTHMTKIRNTN